MAAALTYLTRTPSSASNRKTWTWSGWVKRSDVLKGYQTLFSSDQDINNMTRILFWNGNQLTVSSKVGGSFPIDYRLTRTFRDTSAWYHIVVAMDTTQATDTNRLKIYINGVLETAYEGSSSSLPSLDEDTWINSTNAQDIGRVSSIVPGSYFEGSMSHINFIDGTAYDASYFGETDATTGQWKIKTSPSVTYGTNGFFILKDGNSVTDQSGRGNNFTATPQFSKTEDSPSNNFVTMNPLNIDYANTESNFGAGNTFILPTSDAAYNYAMSTIAMPKGNGKYYFEMKYYPWDSVETAVGIVNMDYASDLFYQNRQIITAANNTNIGRVLITSDGHAITSGTANSSYGFGSWSNGDIICMACDMENGAFYFRKNGGSWANSGDPTSGTTKTGAIDISSTSIWTQSSQWGIWCGDNSSGGTNRLSFNFGNGNFAYVAGGGGASATFGVNAVASAGTNASNNGIFEFNVPTGYTALSTKGLNL